MSRLVLSSVLVALVVGLTLLACVPIEDELLPNIGDEMRITDDPEPNYDPCWFAYFYHNWEDPPSMSSAQIAYHDGKTIYSYSIAEKTTEELYTAPAGYEITALTMGSSYYYELWIALYNGVDAKVVRRNRINEIATIIEDQGAKITSIAGRYEGHERSLLFGRADGNIYHYFMDQHSHVSINIISEGFDAYQLDYYYNDYDYDYNFYFAKNDGTGTRIYELEVLHPEYPDYELDYVLDSLLYNGYNNRYPMHQICSSDAGGDVDIWSFGDDVQITDKPGDEIELNMLNDYIVFNRVENGVSDIYIVRRK